MMSKLQQIRRWCASARPVFVCGLERSGTSTLQLALSRHPALFPVRDVYETFAFTQPQRLRADPMPGMARAYVGGPIHARQFQRLALELSPEHEPLPDHDLIRLFFHYAAHRTYPGREPLEKTPGHVRRIPLMLKLFPQARVIACTRDPVEIVASYRKRLAKEQSLGKPRDAWAWLDKTPEQLIQHFRQTSQRLAEAAQAHPGRVFVCPYDWLTGSPEAALRQLCDFAGLPYDPALLEASGGRGRVDELLSQPIGRREAADTTPWVDADTAAQVRAATAPLMPLWNTPGTPHPEDRQT